MQILKKIPLLLIPFTLYHIFVMAGTDFDGDLTSLNLISGASFTLSNGEFLVLLSLVFLYVEIFKSTRTTTASIFDHLLSLFLCIVSLIEFLTWASAGTATFFLIMMMMLVDVIGGFTITITGARRDFGMGHGDG